MALTVTLTNITIFGNKRFIQGKIAFDTSYPTGGEAFSLADMGLAGGVLDFCMFEPESGYIFEYDHTNNKVLAYYCDYDAVADGALIQVANTTDLSALTDARFIAIGS